MGMPIIFAANEHGHAYASKIKAVVPIYSPSTERSVRVRLTAEDFIKMVRNERRSIAHRTPSRTAVTVAARGLEYMSANSPKPGVVQHDVPHEHTRDGDLELFW